MSAIEAIPEVVAPPEAFNERHQFDAERVAQLYDISMAAVAAALGKSPEGVRRRKAAEGLQDGLGHLALLFADLNTLHAHDRSAVLRWLNTPNRALKDSARPRTLLERGELSVFEALVNAMKHRQPL